jgi:hypothetical protein
LLTAGFKVALQAGLIILGKFGQPGLIVMAAGAFFRCRFIQKGFIGFRPKLVVGMMALDASFKILPGCNILSGMTALSNLFNDLLMTGGAGVDLKKFRRAAIDIDRVRVLCLFDNIAVAVLAG